MCCATCDTPTAASTPPRTPTHPTSTATGTKGCSTRGRPTRCARAPRRTPTAALEWYGITESGNFEGRSIPNRLTARGQLARTPEIEAARQRLFDARAQRPRPLLDDKVITEWNALFLATLAEAAAMLGPSRLAAGRDRQRRVPAPRAPAARRPVAPELAGRRHAAGSPRRARRRSRRARRRVHPVRRGVRAGALDRCRPRDGRRPARPLLGRRPRRRVHDRRRRRTARRPPEGHPRQRHTVGQLDRRRSRSRGSPRSRVRCATPTTPTESSNCSAP